MVLVQAIVEPSIIAWGFYALNLINLSYMMKGSSHRSDLRVQYYIVNIIKVYSLAVIIVTILVLANSNVIDHDEEWANVK